MRRIPFLEFKGIKERLYGNENPVRHKNKIATKLINFAAVLVCLTN